MPFTFEDEVANFLKKPLIQKGDKLAFQAIRLDLTDYNFPADRPAGIKYTIISTVPSLDTSVCYKQTQTFNKSLQKHPEFLVLTLSRDLPFAANRICASFDVKPQNHLVLSDYKYRSFGEKTGLYIPDLEILARSVLILDQDNKLVYLQITNKIPEELDYQALYNFLGIEGD